MSNKRNHKRPDPAAQDPMDYLLDDVLASVDTLAAEFQNMAGLEADPTATLAEHCHTLAGRLGALAEVVRQMRELQRGLVVISDPPAPVPVQITEDQLAALQLAQAGRTLVRWRMGDDGLVPVYADQELPTEAEAQAIINGVQIRLTGDAGTDPDVDASAPAPRRMTEAEALAKAEQLGGAGGAIFLMHWQKTSGGQ